jgi:tetratricopeptide (TPR) repeat protein
VDAISYLVLRLARPFSLNIDPDLRVASSWNLTLAVEAAFLALIVAAGLLSRRRRRWWALGLAWFFLQLLPTNSLLPRADLANDRHLYLACFGIFVAAGIEIGRLAGPSAPARRWPWPLVAATAIVLAASTALRNRDYGSEIALWEQTARVSPGKPRVFNNLGHAYSQAGQLEAAERAYREALRLHPDYALARENLELLMRRKAGRAPAPD